MSKKPDENKDESPNLNDGIGVFRAMGEVAKRLSQVGVAASERNQQQNYNYRGIKAFLDTASPILAECGLLIIPKRVRHHEEVVRQSAQGKALYYVTVSMEFAFVATEDGSIYLGQSIGTGMDSGDKAMAKAMTAAYKTLLIETFAIPMEGTPEPEDDSHEFVFTQIPEEQLDEIKGLAMQTETNEQQFCQWIAQVDTFEELDVNIAPRAIMALNKKHEVMVAQNLGGGTDGE